MFTDDCLLYRKIKCQADTSLVSSSIIVLLFYFSVSWSKMTILIKINNGQPIPLMWYRFILLFFRILALENIAKILTTGSRLSRYPCSTKDLDSLQVWGKEWQIEFNVDKCTWDHPHQYKEKKHSVPLPDSSNYTQIIRRGKLSGSHHHPWSILEMPHWQHNKEGKLHHCLSATNHEMPKQRPMSALSSSMIPLTGHLLSNVTKTNSKRSNSERRGLSTMPKSTKSVSLRWFPRLAGINYYPETPEHQEPTRTTQPTTSAKECLPEQLFTGYHHPLESPPPRHSRTANIGTLPIGVGTEQLRRDHAINLF